jgi:hypothetical protein
MPIRADLVPLYRTPEAVASTRECLERAGYKCEECGKRHMETVRTLPGGLWYDETCHEWRAPLGQLAEDLMLRVRNPHTVGKTILVKIGAAHLDHDPRNNSAGNRRALCQRDHLIYDRIQHKQTRSTRKDAARPLLREVAR